MLASISPADVYLALKRLQDAVGTAEEALLLMQFVGLVFDNIESLRSHDMKDDDLIALVVEATTPDTSDESIDPHQSSLSRYRRRAVG